jgi:5-methylcytosine-specific restriction endonuclease McrA
MPGNPKYTGRQWREFRRTIPPADCPCGARWQPNFHLDHIIAVAAGGRDDPSAVQWLCRSCHSSKTSHADGGLGHPKRDASTWRPKRVAIGTDGWPTR